MRFTISRSLLILVMLLSPLSLAADTAEKSPVPLIHVHAHNDYEHPRPFFDAAECGFCSFEADIFLVDGKLPVAHNRFAVKLDRTLQSLYLDPMKKQIDANGGRLYRDGPPVWLLIDVKGDADEIYAALRPVLKEYSPLFTYWDHGVKHEGPITAVISGNRARKAISDDSVRYCAYDGLLGDLDKDPPADLVPWISEQWTSHFKWKGKGPIPADEKQKLLDIVAKAHQQHRLVRFWGGPDFEEFWKELRDDGVDLLNTDHLKECRDFLLKEGKEGTR